MFNLSFLVFFVSKKGNALPFFPKMGHRSITITKNEVKMFLSKKYTFLKNDMSLVCIPIHSKTIIEAEGHFSKKGTHILLYLFVVIDIGSFILPNYCIL